MYYILYIIIYVYKYKIEYTLISNYLFIYR